MIPQVLPLFTGIFGVLLLASLIGASLRWKLGPGNSVVGNLNARIIAWWWMVGLLLGAFSLGKAGLVLLFLFVSFQGLREFLSLTYTRRGDHRALVGLFFILLPLQYWLVYSNWYGLFSILIPVYGFLLLPTVSVLSQDSTRFLERTSKVQWGAMLAIYCLSHVPALLNLRIPGHEEAGPLLVVFLMLVVQGSDVLQYVWGKLFGRHRVSPEISPSKTWEGLIGGVLSSSALGAALHGFTPFLWWQAGLIALIINLMGFFGGLVLSAIKRDRGVKDWGDLIEGHGGMLDRVDSLSFAAPIFFHVIRFWWT
ncbi:MAG: phosphatidate cytidylyltransferase [Fibrobacteria bacterium]|nr:phosphatidate cytidylyltransferase [Fibrobacteria bacterium]